ncbi:GIY-YIG nuclease family protein [Flagellimonas iocasae]|uniref:GIY-YIG nuclease family protein n=1 Tax=Flagellimonas iocasae TaxID=2055905 RepID=A0ABW4XYP1_9FLAO
MGLERYLMGDNNFKSLLNCENMIPPAPGVYCIRIANPSLLKPSISKVLQQRNHNIIYIGMASKSLKVRFLGQELRAKGHGSFFRSLGAILGYTPEKGSLVGKKNQQNYKFSKSHEAEIIDWINNNLLVNWVECENDLKHKEEALIAKYLPLLNISKNPGVLKEVIEARNNCKLIARNN